MCAIDSDERCMGPLPPRSYNQPCWGCEAHNKDECSTNCPNAKRRPIELRDWNGGQGRKTAI